MQKLLATFITLGFLNPLCCCLTLADLVQADAVYEAATACCMDEAESKEAPDQGHDATRCEHQVDKDAVHKSNSTSVMPEVRVISSESPLPTPIYPRHLQFAPAVLEKRGASEPFIESWVSVQTDCVRRL